MKKEKLSYTIIAILIFILMILVLDNIDRVGATKIGKKEVLTFKPAQTPIEISSLKKKNLIHTISSNGIIQPLQETEIYAQVSGTITRLSIREGSFVRKGSLLAQIDDTLLRIAYQKTQEKFHKALREYALQKVLDVSANDKRVNIEKLRAFNDKGTQNVNDIEVLQFLQNHSRRELFAISVGLNESRIDLRQAEIVLKNASIESPFEGFVADLDANEFEFVKAGQKLMRIISLDKLVVEVGILETEIQFLKLGTKAKIEIAAFPGKTFEGTVSTINPILDPENGTCRVRIEVDNSKRIIKPGMFAQVALVSQVLQERLLIPKDAVLIRDDRKVTFVHENGRAKWRYVKTGSENQEQVEIIKGLTEGDELIVSGHFHLAHNAEVVVENHQ